MSTPDTSTLLLTTSQIKELVTMKDAVEALREVYKEHHEGKTKTVPRHSIPFDQYNGSVNYMISAVDSLGVSAAKIISLYVDNPSRGLPRLTSVVALNSIENGLPTAIMDGNYLTMMRTGAVGALAVEYLARRDAHTAGILGAGVQGRGQLMGICQVRTPRKILFYDVSKKAARSLADDARRLYGVETAVVDSPAEMKECDIIAAATPSTEPLVTEELLHPGLHVNSVGIGSGGLQKQEVDFEILRRLKIVVEDVSVASEETLAAAIRKGLFTSDEVYATIGELITSEKRGRTGDEVTAFFAGGMAIQDLAVARLAYVRAQERGVGQRIRFSD